MRASMLLAIAVTVGLAFAVTTTANAQVAPTGDHYGGRPTDTGFGNQVNSNGSYAASIPFDLPATRDGMPVPARVVYGGHAFGAAGLGWDVPISSIRMETSIAHRKPRYAPDLAVSPRVQVTLELDGTTVQLICDGALSGLTCGGTWVAHANHTLISAVQQSGAWLVYDGQGRIYTFTQPAALGSQTLWLLTSVRGVHGGVGPSPDNAAGTIMILNYDVHAVSWNTSTTVGAGVSIDLTSIDYNFHPTSGSCPKHEVAFTYGPDSTAPLSLSVLGGTPGAFDNALLVRMHTVTNVNVNSRPDCNSSFTALRNYAFSYAPDMDTQQPRLASVQVYGHGAQAGTAMPIASYQYGSAVKSVSGVPTLTYARQATNIETPIGADDSMISGTLSTSLTLPGSGQSYGTFQSLADVTGDGVPDFIFTDPSSQTLMVADGTATSGGLVFGSPVVLGDLGSGSLTPTTVHGPYEDRMLGEPRYSEGIAPNIDNVWRQAIDVNGDGRIDIIDAAETPGQWTIYLNTPDPGGASGVIWQKRAIPIDSVVSQLTAAGDQTLDNASFLPLARRLTGTAYFTGSNGEEWAALGTTEHTFVEWELADINGDGYPDFVFNSRAAGMFTTAGEAGSVYHYPNVGEGNDVTVLFNVGGIMMNADTGSAGGLTSEFFALGQVMLEDDSCGVEHWEQQVGRRSLHPGPAVLAHRRQRRRPARSRREHDRLLRLRRRHVLLVLHQLADARHRRPDRGVQHRAGPVQQR